MAKTKQQKKETIDKLEQALNDLCRIRAPVDQIAQEDDDGVGRAARDVVRLHLAQEVVEQPLMLALLHEAAQRAGGKRREID